MLIDFRQLFPKYGIKPKGVLHVGANVGEEAPVYNELGIPRVLWIEADHDIVPKLQKNISKFINQECLNYAIFDKDQKNVKFNRANNGGQSSSLLELGEHKRQHPDVFYINHFFTDTYRIDSLLALNLLPEYFHGLDFLNIDVQGADGHVLKGMGETLHQFKWINIESNKAQTYIGNIEVSDVDLFLNGFGFKRVETHWCGIWGDAIYIKGR
jgi:FkbM family methyltransferase